jgi:hypothetical protein
MNAIRCQPRPFARCLRRALVRCTDQPISHTPTSKNTATHAQPSHPVFTHCTAATAAISVHTDPTKTDLAIRDPAIRDRRFELTSSILTRHRRRPSESRTPQPTARRSTESTDRHAVYCHRQQTDGGWATRASRAWHQCRLRRRLEAAGSIGRKRAIRAAIGHTLPETIRESRYRYFGAEGSFKELATVSLWQDRTGAEDVTALLEPRPSMALDDPRLADVSPTLRPAFVSGDAPVHDRARLPREFDGLPNGHGGSHHYLVDDFARAVTAGVLPPVNAWVAARYTLPGLVAHQSALLGGERLLIDDLGDAPAAAAIW